MKKADKDLKGTVTKSNELVLRSRYKISNIQDKLIRLAISQLPIMTEEEIKDLEAEADQLIFKNTPKVILETQDYLKLVDTPIGGSEYKRIREAVISLEKQKVWIQKPNNPNEETTVGWILKPTANSGDGTITLPIDPHILRYVRGLQEKFIEYGVLDTLKMTSIYSRMLYEILLTESWKDGDIHRISVSDLRKYFHLEDTKYTRFSNFKARCIEPSVEEINKNTNMQVSCNYIYRGKTCEFVEFEIKGDIKKAKKGKGKSKGKAVNFSDPNCNYECDGQESLDLEKLDPDKKGTKKGAAEKAKRSHHKKAVNQFVKNCQSQPDPIREEVDLDATYMQRNLSRMKKSEES